MVLNCDGLFACAGSTVYCPEDRICNISVTNNGESPEWIYASSSFKLLVTVSEDLRSSVSTIHCPLPLTTITNYGQSTVHHFCALWIDGENGGGLDVYTIFSNDIDYLTLECSNPPCHSHLKTIDMGETHSSICILKPTQQFGGYQMKECFVSGRAENETCTIFPPDGIHLETMEMTGVSDDGKYFHFDDDWCSSGVVSEILYETVEGISEWIPVVTEGINDCFGSLDGMNVTMRRHPLRAAAAGDWELGSFKRLRTDALDNCGEGLECVSPIYTSSSHYTCQAIATTPSPTDNSANGYSFLFSLMLASLFCFIL